jgi:hypothetical protein
MGRDCIRAVVCYLIHAEELFSSWCNGERRDCPFDYIFGGSCGGGLIAGDGNLLTTDTMMYLYFATRVCCNYVISFHLSSRQLISLLSVKVLWLFFCNVLYFVILQCSLTCHIDRFLKALTDNIYKIGIISIDLFAC